MRKTVKMGNILSKNGQNLVEKEEFFISLNEKK